VPLLGIDIGGTSTHVVVCDDSLTVLAEAVAPTPRGGPAMLETAADLSRGLLARFPDVDAAGVAAAGVLDPATGTIVRASDSFHDWEGTAVGVDLTRALDLPVAVDNDVNCFLLGEVAAGALLGAVAAVGITLGTGVGGALWSDGRILHGLRGGAGEIGHLPGFGDLPCTCGQRGHLETLASGPSIARRYRVAAGGGAAVTAADVATRARAGDAAAQRVLHEAGTALGTAIVAGTRLLGADRVVVGGGVAGAWDLLEPAVTAATDLAPPLFGDPLQVTPTRLGRSAVAVGAAALAVGGRG